MLESFPRTFTLRTAAPAIVTLVLCLVLLLPWLSSPPSRSQLVMVSTPSDNNMINEDVLSYNLWSALFPIEPILSGWSTSSPLSSAPARISFLPLSDTTLRSTKIAHSTLRHTLVDAPPGLGAPGKAFRANYTEGSINPGGKVKGGFSFYAPGPMEAELVAAREVVFSYSVYFEDGFRFNKGGKLPGLYGGSSPEQAYACSGGRKDDRDSCFSLRLMWRTSGAGELYAYLPAVPANEVLCSVPPKSVCNDDFGISVGRGSWSFQPGRWTTVAQRVRLNDAGRENGQLDIFVNGTSALTTSNLVIRKSEECTFRGAHMQTFFGGSGADWASPQDQSAYFAGFSLSIIG